MQGLKWALCYMNAHTGIKQHYDNLWWENIIKVLSYGFNKKLKIQDSSTIIIPDAISTLTHNRVKMNKPIHWPQILIVIHNKRPFKWPLYHVHSICAVILIIQQWKINANMFSYNNKTLIYSSTLSLNGLNPQMSL